MTIALIDANVLYPAPLRDLFLWLAAGGVYRPRWSEQIHDEWMRNVLANRPDLSRAQLERTRKLMDQVDPDSLVAGYEVHIPNLTLPDSDDRHVLAAAIQAKVTTLVTFNLSDFPARTLATEGIVAQHPDAFLCSLFDIQAEAFVVAASRHRASLHRPAKSVEEYLRHPATERIVAIGNPPTTTQKRVIRTSPCASAKRLRYAFRWRLW